nr:MAG TPA: hypothetical protein [Caudoviricetes sp.]
MPFILNPPRSRRRVYCRAVRLTKTLCCFDGLKITLVMIDGNNLIYIYHHKSYM